MCACLYVCVSVGARAFEHIDHRVHGFRSTQESTSGWLGDDQISETENRAVLPKEERGGGGGGGWGGGGGGGVLKKKKKTKKNKKTKSVAEKKKYK